MHVIIYVFVLMCFLFYISGPKKTYFPILMHVIYAFIVILIVLVVLVIGTKVFVWKVSIHLFLIQMVSSAVE